MAPSTFGEMVKQFRMRAGLTQRQLADRARPKLDFTYVSKIEGNKVPPPAREAIEALAVALRLTPEERLELVTAAGRVPADLEQWVVKEPRARQLYRSIQQLPDAERDEMLERLIRQVERDIGREPEQSSRQAPPQRSRSGDR
jgi:transcriptional regulator with XRE-family HTH domain